MVINPFMYRDPLLLQRFPLLGLSTLHNALVCHLTTDNSKTRGDVGVVRLRWLRLTVRGCFKNARTGKWSTTCRYSADSIYIAIMYYMRILFVVQDHRIYYLNYTMLYNLWSVAMPCSSWNQLRAAFWTLRATTRERGSVNSCNTWGIRLLQMLRMLHGNRRIPKIQKIQKIQKTTARQL